MGHYDAGVRCTVIRDTAMDCYFYILLEYVGGHNMQIVVLFYTHPQPPGTGTGPSALPHPMLSGIRNRSARERDRISRMIGVRNGRLAAPPPSEFH